MNLTRLNFQESLPFLLKTVSSSNFIGLDLEMSGITSPVALKTQPSRTDSMQVRYHKTRRRIHKFAPVQLGLCCVKYEQPNRVVYSPFNIYLYPFSLSEKVGAEQFVFNSQSMKFLAQNGYNFNLFFYEGVPYVNNKKIRQFERYQENSDVRQHLTNMNLMMSPDAIAFLQHNWQTVRQFSQSASVGTASELLIDIRYVRLKVCNALIQRTKSEFCSLNFRFEYLNRDKEVLDEADPNSLIRRCYLRISIVATPPLAEDGPPTKDSKQSPLNECFINEVIDKISEQKCPLIVHNGFLDLMHIYHRFVDQLPVEEVTYRREIHRMFPTIFDTKYICHNNAQTMSKLQGNTSLGDCYRMFRQAEQAQQTKHSLSQISVMNEMCQQYTFDSQAHHEAGYDALMTCYTFLNAMKVMQKPIQQLIHEFESVAEICGNKIPLGNIRLPYNLSEPSSLTKEEQAYMAQGTNKFHFSRLSAADDGQTPLHHDTFEELQNISETLEQHFTDRYGPVLLIWASGRDSFDFVISFIDQGSEYKLKRDMLGDPKSNQYYLYRVGSQQYLVRFERVAQEPY